MLSMAGPAPALVARLSTSVSGAHGVIVRAPGRRPSPRGTVRSEHSMASSQVCDKTPRPSDQAEVGSPADRLHAVAGAQLHQQAANVELDGVLGDVECVRDLRVREVLLQQAEDLVLARG